MPHNPIRVVVGPANYFSHPGSFNHLNDFFTDEQLSRAVWIYGKRAIAAAQTKLPPAFGLQGQSIFCFVVIAAKAMYSNWRLSPVTIAAW